jgi:ribosomal protein S21
MTQIILGENEGIESALPRFKPEVSQAGFFEILESTVNLKRLRKSANAKQLPNTNSVREVSAIDNNKCLL